MRIPKPTIIALLSPPFSFGLLHHRHHFNNRQQNEMQITTMIVTYTDVHNKLLGGKPVTISVAPRIVPALILVARERGCVCVREYKIYMSIVG